MVQNGCIAQADAPFHRIETIDRHAKRGLGLQHGSHEWLFAASRTLDEVKHGLKEIASGRGDELARVLFQQMRSSGEDSYEV